MRIRLSELKKIVRDVLGETFADGSRLSTVEGDETPETKRSHGTPHDVEKLLTDMWDLEDGEDYVRYGERIPDSGYGSGPDTVVDAIPKTVRSRGEAEDLAMADTELPPDTEMEPSPFTLRSSGQRNVQEIFGFGEDSDTKQLREKGFRQIGREEGREALGPGIYDDMRSYGQEIWQNKQGKYIRRNSEHGGFTGPFNTAEDLVQNWESRIGAPKPNKSDSLY